MANTTDANSCNAEIAALRTSQCHEHHHVTKIAALEWLNKKTPWKGGALDPEYSGSQKLSLVAQIGGVS